MATPAESKVLSGTHSDFLSQYVNVFGQNDTFNSPPNWIAAAAFLDGSFYNGQQFTSGTHDALPSLGWTLLPAVLTGGADGLLQMDLHASGGNGSTISAGTHDVSVGLGFTNPQNFGGSAPGTDPVMTAGQAVVYVMTASP